MKKFLALVVLALVLGTIFVARGDPEKPAGSSGIHVTPLTSCVAEADQLHAASKASKASDGRFPRHSGGVAPT
jgi:hypothetical protein